MFSGGIENDQWYKNKLIQRVVSFWILNSNELKFIALILNVWYIDIKKGYFFPSTSIIIAVEAVLFFSYDSSGCRFFYHPVNQLNVSNYDYVVRRYTFGKIQESIDKSRYSKAFRVVRRTFSPFVFNKNTYLSSVGI